MNKVRQGSAGNSRAISRTEVSERLCAIGEVSQEIGVPRHVLRFRETRFPELRPVRAASGRRLYNLDHISLLKGIKALLYEDGMTIRGVRRTLACEGVPSVVERGLAVAELGFSRSGPNGRGDDSRSGDVARTGALATGHARISRRSRADGLRTGMLRLERLLARLENGRQGSAPSAIERRCAASVVARPDERGKGLCPVLNAQCPVDGGQVHLDRPGDNGKLRG